MAAESQTAPMLATAPPSAQVMGGPSARSVADHEEDLLAAQESSPAYKVLREHQLITKAYKIRNAREINCEMANSTLGTNCVKRLACGIMCMPYECCAAKNFLVEDGHIVPAQSQNEFRFYGPGAHRVIDPFTTVGQPVSMLNEVIKHGTRTIVTIPQGYIGLCTDRGQPILLPPGMHQWESDTMMFQEKVDLAKHVIHLGPWTIVTVDEGYAAVTQDNGRQVVLEGGKTHMLTHRQWKFEKFISMKIQTNDLQQVQATTGDNVVLSTTATVNWQIQDVTLAARMAAETMNAKGMQDDIAKLRQDVLKQAQASLSAFIGSVRYGGSTDPAAMNTIRAPGAAAPSSSMGGMENLYDAKKLGNAVDHANEICHRYGVHIISINIISAVPTDLRLQEALAKGAVAAAEAEQAEVAASGNARALLIKTKAESDSQLVSAKADADAARIRAEGELDAARKLEQSQVAVELERINQCGKATGDKATFFFGANAGDLPGLFANPNLVKPPAQAAGHGLFR